MENNDATVNNSIFSFNRKNHLSVKREKNHLYFARCFFPMQNEYFCHYWSLRFLLSTVPWRSWFGGPNIKPVRAMVTNCRKVCQPLGPWDRGTESQELMDSDKMHKLCSKISLQLHTNKNRHRDKKICKICTVDKPKIPDTLFVSSGCNLTF